jgi:hypothetical protein
MAVSHVLSSPAGNWTGTVTVFNSQGSTTTVAATALVRPQDWNSAHNQFYSLFGNTSLSSTASGTNVQFGVSGPYLSIIGSSDSVVLSSPPHISSMEFPTAGPNQTASVLVSNGGSTSAGVGFNIKQPVSASFLRFFASLSNVTTTYGTTGQSLSASVEMYSTWNAVVYSMCTGASSKSLMSVTSGSCGATQRNSISVAANGTQYSVTQQATFPVEGGTTTTSTQYSSSQTNYSIQSTYLTPFSNYRGIDIPFAVSLPAGAYWLLLGHSSSSTSNSTGVSLASNGLMRFVSVVVCATQLNQAVGIMGSTNFVPNGLFAAGSFSTAGGGTTANFPLSAISTAASHPQVYFQLLRSA